MPQAKIVIIGGGTVGLLTAYLLTQRNIHVELIESLKGINENDRAYYLQASTLDMLSAYPSIMEKILKIGKKFHAISYWDGRDFKCVASFPLASLSQETRHPYRLAISQATISKILLEELQKSSYFSSKFNCNFTQISQDKKGITVYTDDKNLKPIHADFVCGCDGSHSKVRSEVLRINRSISKYKENFYAIDLKNFDVQWIMPGLKELAYLFGGNLYMHAALQLTEDTARFVFYSTKDINSPEGKIEIEESKNKLFEYVPLHDLSTIQETRRASFNIYSSIVDSFNNHRIFLAGDSAHLNSPVGALGLNTGMQDSYYFAYAVELFLHHNNSNGLNAYSAQRRKWVIENTLVTSDQNHHDVTQREIIDEIIEKYSRIQQSPQLIHAFLYKQAMIGAFDHKDEYE